MVFFTFFIWILFSLHTTLSGTYLYGKKYLHSVLNTLSETTSIPNAWGVPLGNDMACVHRNLTKVTLHSSQGMMSRA